MDEMTLDVFNKKYNADGNESPDDMHKRMAKEFANIDKEYNEKRENLSLYGMQREDLTEEKIYEYFKDFKYIIPQGSVMATLGTDKISSLSNCIVVGQPLDSYGSIMNKDEQLVQLFKRRCGVGLDISKLRPNNTKVNNAANTSSGAISFMERYSNTCRETAQSGRRGALMLSIDIRHPDVLEFITIKRDLTKVTGANISIRMRDEFMEAVQKNEDYILRFPIDSELPNNTLPLNELTEVNGNYYKRINASEYWDEIIKSAHQSAEPGILFLDNHWDQSPDSVYPAFKGVTTNPCMVGETLVLTNIGWIKFNNLYETFKNNKADRITILTIDADEKYSNSELKDVMLTDENAEIYKIDLSNGEFLLVNDKHKFYNGNFEEVIAIDSKGELIIGATKLVEITDVTKLDYRDSVYDLTCSPNFNFFCIYGKDEIIEKDDIVINENLKFKYFEIVNTKTGYKFAKDLIEGDELI